MGEMIRSDEYNSFRSSVSQKTVIVDSDSDTAWTYYDAGPRCVRCPLICLPPASGKAHIFFKQILALSAACYRVIAIDYPVYWKLRDWCDSFLKLLDHLQLDKVHIFGASLGGFLAQKFAEHTCKCSRVQSLVLCNAFVDTNVFHQTATAQTFWMMPALVLKKMVMGNFEQGVTDADIADSIDFMVESLDNMSQQEMASRLTLNCMDAYVEPHKLDGMPVTVIDVYDMSALSQAVKDEVYKCYPEARRAHLKSGGNFPYLSRADEVNIHLQIHLQRFWHSRHSAWGASEETKKSFLTEHTPQQQAATQCLDSDL